MQFRRLCQLTVAGLCLLNACAHAALPPRAQWRASSSAQETPSQPSSLAIDSDAKTAWTGPFGENHWLQVDLGRVSTVAGVTLQWGLVPTSRYRILVSTDAAHWRTAHVCEDGRGGTEYIAFAPVQARYVRLASAIRTSDWGVWVSEFQPLGTEGVAQVLNVRDGVSLWNGLPSPAHPLPAVKRGLHELRVRVPGDKPIAGLQVEWASARGIVRLDARDAKSNTWREIDVDPQAEGIASVLAAREAFKASELRVTVEAVERTTPAVKQLRLLSDTETATPFERYRIAASRRFADAFPSTLQAKQVYWTVVGVPGGLQKSLFDEFGNVEAIRGAPLVQPLWREASGAIVSTTGRDRTQALRDGWLPMPSMQSKLQAGLTLRIEALGTMLSGQPYTLVRYRLRNDSPKEISGRFVLLVRPVQVNPVWQHGGFAPIRSIALENGVDTTAVRVNERVLLQSLSAVDARSVAPFGAHGEQEMTRLVAEGRAPQALKADDPNGLAAASLGYDVQLQPGQSRDIVLSFPLSAAPSHTPGLEDTAFDPIADDVAKQWHARLDSVGLQLPDAALADGMRAQLAYMLINQTGPALQPGPRNYDRSFIRDGAASAALMLRFGMPKVARDYLRWYTDHAVRENGLVSPILNTDGSVATGFGADIEYDSQGQFIGLVADVARLDGGPESVREYLPAVRRALQFLVELRDRTRVPNYLAERESPQRFRGILAPSISHEGFGTPHHSYWDDYWALRGWHDGEWLARALGDVQTASWAHQQGIALRVSLADSIRETMAWKRTPLIPSTADRGEEDATSLSIALDPIDAIDVFEPDALRKTFDAYFNQVRARGADGSNVAYTPYEFRNVLSFVRLNQPERAQQLLATLWRDRRPWYVFPEVVHSDRRRAIYIGDMPHTWIGGEFVRAVVGLLVHESDDRLELLPGAPGTWLEGDGLRIDDMPTAFGKLDFDARMQGTTLIARTSGLASGAHVELHWPNRQRPKWVKVDGRAVDNASAESIRLDRPFTLLEAHW